MFVICHLKEWQAQSYTTTSRCESGCSYRMHGDKWQDTTDAKKKPLGGLKELIPAPFPSQQISFIFSGMIRIH